MDFEAEAKKVDEEYRYFRDLLNKINNDIPIEFDKSYVVKRCNTLLDVREYLFKLAGGVRFNG